MTNFFDKLKKGMKIKNISNNNVSKSEQSENQDSAEQNEADSYIEENKNLPDSSPEVFENLPDLEKKAEDLPDLEENPVEENPIKEIPPEESQPEKSPSEEIETEKSFRIEKVSFSSPPLKEEVFSSKKDKKEPKKSSSKKDKSERKTSKKKLIRIEQESAFVRSDPAIEDKKTMTDKKKKWFEPEGQLVVDVYETNGEIVIQSAIAGVKPEDLDISIENDMITIKGKREQLEEQSDVNYFYQECHWGYFSREIVLPAEVNSGKTEAKIQNGILTIRIPKIERDGRKKIFVEE